MSRCKRLLQQSDKMRSRVDSAATDARQCSAFLLPSDPHMHIVADENIPLLQAFFADQGRLTTLPGRSIRREHLLDADALLVRSVTRVDPAMLEGTPVQFVGTCTIGTDHLDLPGLATAGITVASAPGCNARGVVEYVLSCLLTLSERTGLPWRERRVGIVGVGEVGSRLAATLGALGVECVLCDPPRAARGEAGFVELDALLAQVDVVSCHVPLTRNGPDATWHLLDAPRLMALQHGTWLINSSRGPVIDNHALSVLLAERPDVQVALDVWELEPQVDTALLKLCALGTPHIAGYSLDGKLRGTEQIYQAWCRHRGEQPRLTLQALAPEAGCAQLQFSAETPAQWMLEKALRQVYDVRDDDARFRAMMMPLAGQSTGAAFDALRKDYPLRRECPQVRILHADGEGQAALMAAAGFNV